MKVSILFFSALIFFLSACGPKTIYEHKISLPERWSYDYPINFEFIIEDSIPSYDLILEIEHQNDYNFQNIYTKMSTVFPDETKKEQIISLTLVDQMNQWAGKCNSGFCITQIGLSENIYFSQLGKYTIKIEQYGRQDNLMGIKSLTLKVVHAQKSKD